MLLTRRIGALVLAAVAVLVWFAMAPETPEEAHADAVASIEAEDAANNTITDGAPQQTVVNGWTANEYLKLISTQLNGSQDPRPAALLGLGVLGLALIAFTTPPLARPQSGRQPGRRPRARHQRLRQGLRRLPRARTVLTHRQPGNPRPTRPTRPTVAGCPPRPCRVCPPPASTANRAPASAPGGSGGQLVSLEHLGGVPAQVLRCRQWRPRAGL